MVKIGELLVKKGFITAAQLETALKESRKSGEILGMALVRLELVTQEQLLEVLAEQLGAYLLSQPEGYTGCPRGHKICPGKTGMAL